MKLKAVLTVSAIYQAVVGIGMMLVPRQFGIDAVPADSSPALIAFLRIFGGPMLGIAVLNWMARNAEPSAAPTAIVLANIVGFGCVTLVDVWGVFTGGARPIAKLFLPDSFAFDCRLRRCMANQHAGAARENKSMKLYAHPFSSYTQKALIALYENDTAFTFRASKSRTTTRARRHCGRSQVPHPGGGGPHRAGGHGHHRTPRRSPSRPHRLIPDGDLASRRG